MDAITGWDIGGAHLKAVRVEDGVVTQAVQLPCPLWLGLDQLEAAFAKAVRRIGGSARHAVTMTGELADIFPSRAEGVRSLARIAADCLGAGDLKVYAGPEGFLGGGDLADHVASIASANWHASARWATRALRHGLFVDMGSTTTDLIPLSDGKVAARGYSDCERLAVGELVYTGMVRSFVMSVASRVPCGGRWMPLMNEYFANMADVYRILGDLPAGADQQTTPDGRAKTVAASRVRLARMLGMDAGDAADAAWTEAALSFREAQLRMLHDAAMLVLSGRPLPAQAPIIGAGVGARIVRRLAGRLGRPYVAFSRLIEAASPALRRRASDCAPAAAVALIAQASPGTG